MSVIISNLGLVEHHFLNHTTIVPSHQ